MQSAWRSGVSGISLLRAVSPTVLRPFWSLRGLGTSSSHDAEPDGGDGPLPKYTLVQSGMRRRLAFTVEGCPSRGFIFARTEEHAATRQTHEVAPEGRVGPLGAAWRHFKRLATSTLLPVGYPTTVGPGYMEYVAWQGLTNLAVAANTVLASTFLLYSVGLGAGAIPTAGALNWVLKDGLGQLGTLVFGKTIAHNFDIHSKSWYFLSMMILKIATGVEILTILMPQHFLAMGTLANSLKGLSFMANGSTRSVFNLSFARDNNIADITAKGTSQYICASMFGTVGGATLCSWVGQDSLTALVCYAGLTFVTLYSGYATVKTIPLSTLNNTRLQLLCESYLKAISEAAAAIQQARRLRLGIPAAQGATPGGAGPGPQSLDPDTDTDAGFTFGGGRNGADVRSPEAAAEDEKVYDEYLDPQLPSPALLATEDPPLPFLMGDQRLLDPAIIVGEALDRVLDDAGPELLVLLLTTYRLSRAVVLPRGPTVHILLHQQASQRDICQAYLQACLLRRRMRAGSMVGLAAAQHAIEVRRAQREADEAAALVAKGAGSSWAPLSNSDPGDALVPAPSYTYGDMCAVKGSSSPALAELRIVLQDTLQTAERLTTPFMRCLEAAGWKLEKVVVEAEKRRAHW